MISKAEADDLLAKVRELVRGVLAEGFREPDDHVLNAAMELEALIRGLDLHRWTESRPNTLTGLLVWQTNNPTPMRLRPWAANIAGGSYATDGMSLLFVSGASVTVPRERGIEPPSERLIQSLLETEGTHAGRVDVSLLSALCDEHKRIVIGESVLDSARVAAWFVSAAKVAVDPWINVRYRGPYDAVHAFGSGWQAITMPMANDAVHGVLADRLDGIARVPFIEAEQRTEDER